MERALGIGILGPGWVAAEHIAAWEKNAHTRVVAICGRTKEKALRLREAKGLQQCEVYSDYEEMLTQEDLDIVSICTPNHLHAEEGILAAQAGKHMLIEKPAAITLQSLHALEDTITRAGVTAAVGFVARWSPLLQIIKSLVGSGAIGSPFYAEVDYRSGMLEWYSGFDWSRKTATGGSSFLVAGCHAIDALRWLFGSEVQEVTAYSTGWDSQYEFDATCVAIVKFENGAVGKSLSSIELNMPYGFNIELYGDKGTILNKKLYSLSLLKGQTDFAEIPCVGPATSDVSHHPFEPEVDHLVDCILQGKEPMTSIHDAVKTHEICLAADISAAENRPVRLPLPRG